MKRGTPECGKMYHLAELLGIHRLFAVGIMESLWHTAARYTPHGNIGRYSDAWICERIGWNKKPEVLITALVESKWLDRDETHRLLVHDWPEHCESSVHQFLKKKKEPFANGTWYFARETRTGHEESANGTQTVHERDMSRLRPPSEGKAMAGHGTSEKGGGGGIRDESWLLFAEVALPAGLRASDEELRTVELSLWPRLDFEQKLKAVDGVKLRLESGEYADPAFVPLMDTYVRKKLWTRPPRATPLRGGGARKAVASREFDDWIVDDLKAKGMVKNA